jgi:hypothetical protein
MLASFYSSAGSASSHAADVLLRATHLAETQNTVLGSAAQAAAAMRPGGSPTEAQPRRSLAGTLRVGGDEDCSSPKRRASHESGIRRSISAAAEEAEDKIRRGVAEVVRRASGKGKKPHKKATKEDDEHAGEGHEKNVQDQKHAEQAEVPELPQWTPAYLLVSPLQGLITSLATMSFGNPFGKKKSEAADSDPGPTRRASSHSQLRGSNEEEDVGVAAESELKLVRNPTLAVYGDRDVFVAAKKLREWGARLERRPESRFRAHEISTAGHFWIEERVAYVMRDAVKTFADGLLTASNANQPELTD